MAATVKIRAMETFFSSQPGHHHLRRLAILRAIVIAVQCVVLVLAGQMLDLQLAWLPLASILVFMAALDLYTWWRIRTERPVTNIELFVHLCTDVLALTALLYFSGGSTNPFVSLLLLPLVIAAATLPSRYTFGMAVLTTFCYSLLMKFYVPLSASTHEGMTHDMSSMDHDMSSMSLTQESIFSLHIFGMWLGFVLSVAIISFFVVRMAQTVRERDALLANVREETLRNERIVALGTLAASAAHELGTPLATMSVVIGEMQHEKGGDAEAQQNLTLLDQQVRNCRRILDKMLVESQQTSGQPLDLLLHDIIEEWRLLRPSTTCDYLTTDCGGRQLRNFDAALGPALLNLLNNAADASPERIEVDAHCRGHELIFTILDHGPGLTPEAASKAGSAFFTTKEGGRGLGLFLANATLERMGGSVRLFNRSGGGATTEVTLPLKEAA